MKVVKIDFQYIIVKFHKMRVICQNLFFHTKRLSLGPILNNKALHILLGKQKTRSVAAVSRVCGVGTLPFK